MKETMKSPSCERAPDLVAFIYRELDERETLEYQQHLRECGQCREEVGSLGVVRESITAWRDEALAGFVSTPVKTEPLKSAIAALRQFFDLSPLWLKGATALVVLAFFVLAGLAMIKLRTNNVPTVADAKYTEQDVNQIVNEALAKQANANKPSEKPAEMATEIEPAKPKKSKVTAT